MEKVIKILKENKLHIAIILVGILLLLIPAFHSNIWFDESYSVGIVNHSFGEIWTIGANDVHPILYYWLLKIINLIFGNNIIMYRLFSVAGIITLGILGFTHIRKDFGKKVGLLFSFLSFFMPIMLNYALEIRMYSWTIVFVTLMAIYLNRFIKTKGTKNLVLFGIFSLASCYMHYYALMCAGIVNLGLIIYVIKNRKEFEKKTIIKFIIVEVMQVILYIPWLIFFIMQFIRVKAGFWISLEIPQIFIDIINFQFKANLNEMFATIFSICLFTYVGYLIFRSKKNKEEIKEGVIPLIIYALVVLVAFIVSLSSPILYARYLFTITGLVIFSLAYFLAKEDNKYILIIICTIIFIMSIVNNISVIKENYDENNGKPIEYLKENLQEDDIIIYGQMENGGVLAVKTDNEQYFLNLDYWSIEEAYKAYAPQMRVAYNIDDAIKNAKGRIVVVDTGDLKIYNQFPNKEQYKEISSEKFETKFKNITYNIVILEKNDISNK